MINVGLVGFGLAGKMFHAPFIRLVDGLHLKTIARRSGASDLRYPDVKFVSSVDELLVDKTLELIVIASPNDQHYPTAKQCLVAGRHVVVDKPFTTTLKQAEELVAIAKEKNRIVTVFQNRRWDGDFLTLRKLIDDRALGSILLYESHFDRFRPVLHNSWKQQALPGLGHLYDLAPHLLDQALVLFGAPEAITADLRKERDDTVVDDAFDITFHYRRMRALLRASSQTHAPGPKLWVNGAQAAYTKYGLDPQEDAMKAGGDPSSPGWGREAEDDWGTLTTAHEAKKVPTIPGNYRGFYENVRDAILGKQQIGVTAEDALNVMRAIELAAESNAKRCTVDWRI